MLQLTELFPEFDRLHLKHGDSHLKPIYGAGQTKNPKVLLVFMNPTAKNVSSNLNWVGIQAPWLGTKNVWKLLFKLGLLTNKELIELTSKLRPEEWTAEFSETLYNAVAQDSLYITNIAKCTQIDARHLPDSIFKEYLPSLLNEIELINPEIIFSLGNQVSSTLLSKPVSVSNYLTTEYEELLVKGKTYKVYPTYYPVGQGTRNMSKAIERIQKVVSI